MAGPQKKYDFSDFDTITPKYDFSEFETSKPEPSGLDWWIEQGLRTVPAVVGGVAGGILGGIPGGMAGGAGGSALGNVLGNWYGGREFNPAEFGVETALGAVPPILGPAKFAGKGLGAIAKYAGKTALSGAAEGAVVSGAGTPFQHWAQTGSFDAPLEEYAQNVGAGGLMGLVTGGGIGAYHGRKLNQIPDVPLPKTDVDIDVSAPPPPPAARPSLSISTVAASQPVAGEGLPRVVTIKTPDASIVEYYRNQGYVSVPNLRSPEGYVQMVRGDLAPLYTNAETTPTQVEPTPIQPSVEPVSRREIPGETIEVPTARVNNTFIANMEEGGYTLVDRNPNTVTFKRVAVGEDEPLVSNMADPRARAEAEAELQERARQQRIQQINENIDAGRPPIQEQTPFQTGWDKLTPEGQRAVSQQSADQFNIEAGLQESPLPPTGIDDLRARARMEQIGGDEESLVSRMQADPLEEQRDNLRRMLKREPTQEEFEDYVTAPVTRVPPGSATGAEGSWPQKVRGVSEYEAHGLTRTYPTPGPAFGSEPVSRMQVRQGGYGGGGPVIVNPQTGRPNLAMGGADPQVIRQLGQSLYTRDRPSVLIQELMQNIMDEMKIAGIQNPVRVIFSNASLNPVTKVAQKSIVFQDFGRGMNESQLYNEFSDVGKSGKRHIQGAAGGFGFAKAAPFLGGEHMRVESIVMEGGDKVRYTFEGTPEQFVNQEVGVPLSREVLDDPYNVHYDKPTGLRVEVFFGRDKYFDNAKQLLQVVSENSTGVKNIESYENWLTEDTTDPRSEANKFINKGEQGLSAYDRRANFNRFESAAAPAHVDTIVTPSNDTAVRFNLDDKERSQITLIYLNNGTFYHSTRMNVSRYGIPHIPSRVVFDINTKVPEGHTDYPFPANREGINQSVSTELQQWVKDNIVAPARAKYLGEIQQVYNSLRPESSNRHVVLDSGSKYTPEELARVVNSPTLKKMGGIMKELLDDLATYFTPAELKGTTGKFGYRIADEGQGGINISDPSSPTNAQKFAILVNPMDSFRSGFTGGVRDLTPAEAARRFVHIVKHEFNHNLVRDEGGGFTWAFSQLDTRFPDTEAYVAKVLKAITGPTGNYVAEIPNLVREYTQARGRGESKVDILSRQAESPLLARAGSPGIPGGNQPNGKGVLPGGGKKPVKESIARQLYHAPRGLMATWDLSAPFRQGLPMIHTKQWWTSWKPMLQSLGSEGAYNQIMAEIKARPEFTRPFDPITGKFGKSQAEEAGIRLTDVNDKITGREENTIGGAIEKYVPGVRRTNRAYTAYLNSLRADSFKAILESAKDMGLHPLKDLPLTKAIGDYINTATGRGDLGRFEQSAKVMADIFFAPRLMASRFQMLNPATYIMAPPLVRKQYLKSALATTSAWAGMAGLASMAGAAVSLDPDSADFGKIRIGDTRIDPAGGFQQYIVAGYRLLTGRTKTSGKRYETGADFPAPTRGEIAQRFISNKLNPVASFAYDLAYASKQRPTYVGDRMVQMFVPMIIGDVIELAKENPALLPVVIPATAVGMGSQTYKRGQEESVFIPRGSDLQFKGGSPF